MATYLLRVTAATELDVGDDNRQVAEQLVTAIAAEPQLRQLVKPTSQPRG